MILPAGRRVSNKTGTTKDVAYLSRLLRFKTLLKEKAPVSFEQTNRIIILGWKHFNLLLTGKAPLSFERTNRIVILGRKSVRNYRSKAFVTMCIKLQVVFTNNDRSYLTLGNRISLAFLSACKTEHRVILFGFRSDSLFQVQ
jgi:hypothetical protein